MNLPSGWELILILLVVVVVFGSKRLPDASRSLGRSLRIFKAETKGLRDEDTPTPIPPVGDQPRFDPYTGEPLKPPASNDPAS